MLRTALPVKRIFTTNALRLTPASLQSRSRPALPHRDPHHASFSTTPRRSASEEPETQALINQQQKVARLLQSDPELARLVVDFKDILESEGFTLNEQSMPSKLDMVRMFMRPKVREAAENLFAKFKEAGIDPKDIMDFGASMSKRK
ncbi:hypothetical protein BKA93DRAFT_823948 [Sparassis latifolia]|uniref:Uncharacterized protein n=1 Tax=Sparassis crispa TaxID=139825 RepID=A0A401GAF5_9APHY|nr:hypothetical protein SCP_0203520 [Sparassis crispa]GBE79155.1 hypothetical protein SCP_0203520 [Sparassis crispa]